MAESHVVLWESVPTTDKWNRLTVTAQDAKWVNLLLEVQKPKTALWKKEVKVWASLEQMQAAFKGIGPTWLQPFKNDLDPKFFSAERMISIPGTVYILVWSVRHTQNADETCNITDTLRVYKMGICRNTLMPMITPA